MRPKLTPDIIHELHNIRPDLKNFHILHKYNPLVKSWTYQGHICCMCYCKFKSEKAILIHTEACRYRHGRIDRRVSEESRNPYIIDNNGKEWRPYDTGLAENYQKFADK